MFLAIWKFTGKIIVQGAKKAGFADVCLTSCRERPHAHCWRFFWDVRDFHGLVSGFIGNTGRLGDRTTYSCGVIRCLGGVLYAGTLVVGSGMV